ncbi:hypothetical protein BJX99DRAFT_44887 [Aspergillus californicus]
MSSCWCSCQACTSTTLASQASAIYRRGSPTTNLVVRFVIIKPPDPEEAHRRGMILACKGKPFTNTREVTRSILGLGWLLFVHLFYGIYAKRYGRRYHIYILVAT